MKIVFFSFLLILLACTDNGSPIDSNDPQNLVLDIEVFEDGSGKIEVNASADNATEFWFYTGDDRTEPIVQTQGQLEYTYVASGSYTFEVRAYGPSGRFIEETKKIVVSAQDPDAVGEGYASPFSYSGMELVWNDEFFGNSLNEEFWSYDIGNGCPDLCGWGNNELEYYTKDNSWVEGGLLTIEAREQSIEGFNYSSTKIVTRNKQAFQYGRIDIRATLPKGQGLWPALWMLGTNQTSVGWPKCGEIDIMEMVGGSNRENFISGNAFWDDNGLQEDPSGHTLAQGTFADQFHVFSIVWTENKIQWYMNETMYKELDTSNSAMEEFRNPFYLIFNVAVGGNWPGSPDSTTSFPTQMKVDYVRAFKFI